MRVKIVDALARGVPIVSTTVGAEGLDVIPGQHLLIADTPADFADAVLRLLRNPDLGKRLANAGRRLAETRYDWRHVYTALDELYT
jgi:glycosyltransferase involved in cell wall biosynthesis